MLKSWNKITPIPITLKTVLHTIPVLLFMFVISASHPCYANPIIDTPFVDAYAWLIILWIGCSVFEAGLITFVIWTRHVAAKAVIAGFISIFLLNMASILITSFLAGGIFSLENSPNYWAELFPLIFESLFILYLFRVLYKYGYMKNRMHVGCIILLVIIANLITFLLPYFVFQ